MQSQDGQWLLREKYAGVESEAFHADLKRLSAGEPLSYVIGWVPFLGCKIFLDSNPLIVRSETEYWTEKALNEISKTKSFQFRDQVPKLRILDLCAGSGAIGVAIAKAIPEAHVTFGEIDKAHLPTIERNIKENLIIYDKVDDQSIEGDETSKNDKYPVTESNLFENISGQFDFILTNPPYIDPVLDRAEDSVKNHEPHLALYGGEKGMEVIKQIIEEAPTHLSPEGQLWLEHEPEQTEEITRLANQNGLAAETHEDQYQVQRYSVLVLQ